MDLPGTAGSTNSASSSLDGRGTTSGGGGSEFLSLGMFGQPSGVGDLLLGTVGFGGGSSLSNGYGNDTTVSAPSAVQGNTANPSTAFDLKDFPSLGGAGSGSSTATATATSGLTSALRQQQQQQLLHPQMLQGGQQPKNVATSSSLYRLAMQSGTNGGANFSVATEDFPALPGAPIGGNGGANGSLAGSAASSLLLGNQQATLTSTASGNSFGSVPSRATSTSSGSGLYGTDISGDSTPMDSGSILGSNNLGGLGISGLQSGSSTPTGLSGLQQLQQRSSTPSSISAAGNPAPAPSSNVGGAGAGAGSALSGDFGLLGLLSVIRMTDADRNALALGTDLTMLGLKLNASENLYASFASPFSDAKATKEPHYQLPMCYYLQPPALKTGHLSKFQLETLFYIFYALPKDVLQAYSAQELYSREWRYHSELKRWFTRGEAGSQMYFDINSWERRLFTGNIQNITSGFLSEEEIRVKFPAS